MKFDRMSTTPTKRSSKMAKQAPKIKLVQWVEDGPQPEWDDENTPTLTYRPWPTGKEGIRWAWVLEWLNPDDDGDPQDYVVSRGTAPTPTTSATDGPGPEETEDVLREAQAWLDQNYGG